MCADAIDGLRQLPAESVQCVVTSPPYWGLRDYGIENQLGLEKTPEEYTARMVAIFREVKRVLRNDGTVWLNLGDSYASSAAGNKDETFSDKQASNHGSQIRRTRSNVTSTQKPKDLIGIPWRIAFALQADGWYLRQDIIWAKPNPMPESVTDRCTKSHEYIFLLTKSAKYFYDQEAIKEQSTMRDSGNKNHKCADFQDSRTSKGLAEYSKTGAVEITVNKRSVWTIATEPFPEAHFATFPTKLVEPCILAGTSERGCCSKCGSPIERMVEKIGAIKNVDYQNESRSAMQQGGISSTTLNAVPAKSETIGWQPSCDCNDESIPCTVLDPFCGSGTTGLVAIGLGRKFIGIELNPKYAEMAERRIYNAFPLLCETL